MRVYRPDYTDRNGKKRQYGRWYGEFRDHNGRIRRLRGFTDRGATVELGRHVERLVSLCAAGLPPDKSLNAWLSTLEAYLRRKLEEWSLLDTHRAAASKPLAEHVEDWEAALRAGGATEKHAAQQAWRVKRVAEVCGFKRWREMVGAEIQGCLAELRKERVDDEGKVVRGIGKRTSNAHLQALKQFCRWMVKERRASENPIAHLSRMNAATDRRRVRRALDADEILELLESARKGPAFKRMAGGERAMLYRLALETGLRWSELRSLRVGSFNFVARPATVTVEAAYSKRRRQDVLPLRADSAADFRAYLGDGDASERAFPTMPHDKGARMLREDLQRAKIAETDEAGRVVDFHALRHSFISALARAGVHPRTAQTLARHSTIDLTMNAYTHVAVESQLSAVEQLPALGDTPKRAGNVA